jgi:hypothetical protein
MDVVVQLRKVDAKGNLLTSVNFPIPIPVGELQERTNTTTTLGPQGQLRASHAVSRIEFGNGSNPDIVEYAHDRTKPVPRGAAVRLDITLWPMGMVFGPGEGIMLRVSGHGLTLPEVSLLATTEPVDANVGAHTVHTGGKYDSYLVLPVLPE